MRANAVSYFALGAIKLLRRLMSELIINEQNFNEYFHDVRTHKPEKGQVMACYTAMADFIDGPLKRDVLEILCYHDAMSAPKIMRKMGCAVEKDAYHLPLEMAKDLLAGATVEEVARKPYRYTLEVFFYTKKEYVPKADPHWSIVSIINLNEFLDNAGNKVTIETKEVENENVDGNDLSQAK